jgi:hypothetical protein
MLKFQAAILGGSADKTAALSVTFDSALAALARLPRMFIEPDGSFVWTGTTAEGDRWQVDGNLIDRGDVLAYVELKGCCPEEEFNSLLSALGWPQSPLVFQLTQRGVVLDEASFRRLAASETGAV